VLIIITDGAADNTTDNDSSGQSTYFTATNVAQCNAIKATGTRIAILYTQYLPEMIDYTGKTSFNAFAANSVPKIQAPASGLRQPECRWFLSDADRFDRRQRVDLAQHAVCHVGADRPSGAVRVRAS
jgi:hypothetical protein